MGTPHVFSQYEKPVLVGVALALTILTIFVVALRLFARQRSPAGFGWDDWVIVFALVLCIASGIVEILSAEIGGMGRHQRLGPQGELIHYTELTVYEKCRYANLLITTLNLGVIKTSILLFYRRLFTPKPFRIANAIMMGIVFAWTISFFITAAVQCVPTHLFWDLFEIEYAMHKCINVQQYYLGLAFSDLVMDVIIVTFPIPMVVPLKLAWRQKIKIIDWFLLGAIVLASGIARVTSFMQTVNYTNNHADAYFKDTLWFTAGPLFWTFAETPIAIIGACLPTLATLRPRKHSTHSKRSSYYLTSWPEQNKNTYNTLEDGPRRPEGGNGEDNVSTQRLVGAGTGSGFVPTTGPATNIRANEVKVEDRPQAAEGIKVDTTLESDSRYMG